MSSLCTFVNPGRNVWYEKVLNSFRRINIFAGFVDLNRIFVGRPENPLLFYCNEYLHCNRAVFSNFLYKYSVGSFSSAAVEWPSCGQTPGNWANNFTATPGYPINPTFLSTFNSFIISFIIIISNFSSYLQFNINNLLNRINQI